MKTLEFNNVYVVSSGTAVGPTEKKGPLHMDFDICFDDLYCSEKSMELAERTMLRFACDQALQKAKLRIQDMSVLIGGDLMNQLMTSNYFVRDMQVPFIGVYAACATSALTMGLAAMQVSQSLAKFAMAFTSSHFGTAEKQFRYPNEYAIQKPVTTTTTVTGAGSIIFSQQKSDIAVTSFTLGRVIDWSQRNVNDMGSAMMPAAYDTLQRHMHDLDKTVKDYDLIVTGDLSLVGNRMLVDALHQDGIHDVAHISDCGLLIFDHENQNVFAGGSGCACSMVVTLGHLFKQMQKGTYKKILLIATGALHTPIAIQQHDTIPCIAHAIGFEVKL